MWELDDASDELRRVALEFVKTGTNNRFLHYPHKSPKAAAQTLEGNHTPAGIIGEALHVLDWSETAGWEPASEWRTSQTQLRVYTIQPSIHFSDSITGGEGVLPSSVKRGVLRTAEELLALKVFGSAYLVANPKEKRTQRNAVSELALGTPVHGSEVYSKRLTDPALCERHQLRLGSALDLKIGYDFCCAADRARALRKLDEEDPLFTLLSPECTDFSTAQLTNCSRDPERYKDQLLNSIMHLRFAIYIAKHRIRKGKFILFEQPRFASSWTDREMVTLLDMPEVIHTWGSQCQYGQRVGTGGLNRKDTGWATNSPIVAAAVGIFCDCPKGTHEWLVGGKCKKASRYPDELCDHMLAAMRQQIEASFPHFLVEEENKVLDMDNDEEDGDYDSDEEDETLRGRLQQEILGDREAHEVTRALTDEHQVPEWKPNARMLEGIQLAHDNSGHPATRRFARLLRLGGAPSRIWQWVRKSFKCDACERNSQRPLHRPAAVPRSHQLNYVVGLDTISPSSPRMNGGVRNHGSTHFAGARISSR